MADDKAQVPQRRPTARVLLVDDHDDQTELLRMLLVRRGFEVHTARSVAGALESAQGVSFDVLVSDIGLPDGSGCDLLRALRARRTGSPLPAVALSGRAGAADVESARAAGFDEYLGKPVSIDELVAALRRVTPPSGVPASSD
jgi:DNA-binding response OmpR family regulator